MRQHLMDTGPFRPNDEEEHSGGRNPAPSTSENESRTDLSNTVLLNRGSKFRAPGHPFTRTKNFEKMTLEDSLGMSGTGVNLLSGGISPSVLKGQARDGQGQLLIHMDNMGDDPKTFALLKQGSIEQTVDEAAQEASTESEQQQQSNLNSDIHNSTTERDEALCTGNDQGQQIISTSPQSITKDEKKLGSRNALQLINEPYIGVEENSQVDTTSRGPLSNDRLLQGTSHLTFVKPPVEDPSQQEQSDSMQISSFKHPELEVAKEEPLPNNAHLELYAWGSNNQHQLGQIAFSNRLPSSSDRPQLIHQSVLIPRPLAKLSPAFNSVAQVVCSQHHTLFLTSIGELWGLGSNSHGQMGLNVSHYPLLSEPKQIPVEVETSWSFPRERVQARVTNLATCSDHSIIACEYFSEGRLQKAILGAGINDMEQLGAVTLDGTRKMIVDSFEQVKVVTDYGLLENAKIKKVVCSQKGSGVLLSRHQHADDELWMWGYSNDQSETQPQSNIRKICLPEEASGSIKDVKCGDWRSLVLVSSNRVFVTDNNLEMREILDIGPVREIAAFGEHFAVLTFASEILHWRQQEGEISKLEFETPLNSDLQMLSVGNDFGHAIDKYGNLYGWGNNKNGELGTGDCFPRTKLSQVRIFTNEQQYLRCRQIFNGHEFTFGLFDNLKAISSDGSPLPALSKDSNQLHPLLSRNFEAKHPEGSQVQSSSRFARRSSQEEEREAQIQANEQALENYRRHSEEYRNNTAEYSQALDHPHLPPMQSLHSSNRLEEVSRDRPFARSISPSQPYTTSTLNDPLKQSSYSPDIVVTRKGLESLAAHQRSSLDQQESSAPGGSIGMSKTQPNKYSFSQLQYRFDENRAELSKFRAEPNPEHVLPADTLERQLQKLENYISVDNCVASSNPYQQLPNPSGQTTLLSEEKGQIDFGNPYAMPSSNGKAPPTVTSIETFQKQPSHNTRQLPAHPHEDTYDHGHPPPEVPVHPIERRASELNKMIEKSISATSSLLNKSSIRPSHSAKRRRGPSTRKSSAARPIILKKINQNSTEVNSNMDLSGVYSRPPSRPDSPRGLNQTTEEWANWTRLHGPKRPGMSSSLHDFSLQTRASLEHRQPIVSRDVLRELNQKLNRYKRKLKKYIASMQDLRNHNDHLKKQNTRLLRAQKKRSESIDAYVSEQITDQMKGMESQMLDMQNSYQALLSQKDEQLNQLTQENLMMLDEIHDRDDKHNHLESRFSSLEAELNSLPYILRQATEDNKRLKAELERLKTRREKTKLQNKELRQRLGQDQGPLIHDLEEQLRIAAEDLKVKDQELGFKDIELGKLREECRKVKNEAERYVVGAMEEMRAKLVDKSRTTRQQEHKRGSSFEGYGLLSGKTTEGISQHSLSRQGPLQMNWQQFDQNYKTSSKSNNSSKKSPVAMEPEHMHKQIMTINELSADKNQFGQFGKAKAEEPRPDNYLSFQPSLNQIGQMLDMEATKPPQKFTPGQSFNNQNLPTFQNTEANLKAALGLASEKQIGQAGMQTHYRGQRHYTQNNSQADLAFLPPRMNIQEPVTDPLDSSGVHPERSFVSQATNPTGQASYYKFAPNERRLINHSMMTDFSNNPQTANKSPDAIGSGLHDRSRDFAREAIAENPHDQFQQMNFGIQGQKSFDYGSRFSQPFKQSGQQSLRARSDPSDLRDTGAHEMSLGNLDKQFPNFQYAQQVYSHPSHSQPPVFMEYPQAFHSQMVAHPPSPQLLVQQNSLVTEASHQMQPSGRAYAAQVAQQSQGNPRNMPRRIHVSNFNSGTSPLLVTEFDPFGKLSPNTAHNQAAGRNFNFSELSGGDQQKLIDMFRDNSRSNQSRDNSFLSRNGRQPFKIQNEADQFKQYTTKVSRDPNIGLSTLSPQPFLQAHDLPDEEEPSSGPEIQRSDFKAKYKSAILSKIEKKTNDRIISQMRQRDKFNLLSSQTQKTRQKSEGVNDSSYNPVTRVTVSNNPDSGERRASTKRNSVKSKSSHSNNLPFKRPDERKESLSQLAEKFSDKAKTQYESQSQLKNASRLSSHKLLPPPEEVQQVKKFQEKSKEWYQRKGRPEEVTADAIATKYQEAFKNLSQEVKKKIEGDFSKRYPYYQSKYAQSLERTSSFRDSQEALRPYLRGSDMANYHSQMDMSMTQKTLGGHSEERGKKLGDTDISNRVRHLDSSMMYEATQRTEKVDQMK